MNSIVRNNIATVVPIATPTKPYFFTNTTEITILLIASTQAPTLVSLKWPAAWTIELYGNLIDQIYSLINGKIPNEYLI